MEYSRVPLFLKRYSFEDKMSRACYHSQQTVNIYGMKSLEEMHNIPKPWDLEVFVLFAIKSVEYQYKIFTQTQKFFDITNCIANHSHPNYFIDDIKYENKFLISPLASVQFHIQENAIYKLYRYNYIFTYKNDKIDMNDKFNDFFDCDYKDFCEFGFLLWALVAKQSKDTMPILDNLRRQNKYRRVYENIKITRNEYVEKLDLITSDINDYLYCLRPSYTYAFIEYGDKVYFPLPHLLITAITSSLLYRLTEQNGDLRNLIGKNVLEDYLYHLLSETTLFDEIVSEQVYIGRKGEERTLDVMTRKGDHYYLFDSKSTSPRIGVRTFDEDSRQSNVLRVAESIVQIYNYITEKFDVKSKFFENNVDIKRGNVYGIAVILEDSYLEREFFYKKAGKLLGIEENSDEFRWMVKHIDIMTFSDLERNCFTNSNFLVKIEDREQNGTQYDMFIQNDSNEIQSRKFNEFRQKLKCVCAEFIEN